MEWIIVGAVLAYWNVCLVVGLVTIFRKKKVQVRTPAMVNQETVI